MSTDEKPEEFSDIAKLIQETIAQGILLENMRTLAIEYQDKTITAERFAHQIYKLIVAHHGIKK